MLIKTGLMEIKGFQGEPPRTGLSFVRPEAFEARRKRIQ